MVSNLKLRSPFLLIASQPPACSDVGTSPQSWEESLFRGSRVTGQVTLLAAWARLPFGMRTVNVIFPPQIGKEREKGVADETTGLPWGTSRVHMGGLARAVEDVRMRIESGVERAGRASAWEMAPV